MNPRIDALIRNIQALEEELEAELAKRRDEFRIRLRNGKIDYAHELLQEHRRLKASLPQYIVKAKPLKVLTAPIIYSLIVPFVLLDLAVTLYQAICFPIYGIPKVKRKDYLVFDRGRLAYLNLIEKSIARTVPTATAFSHMSVRSPLVPNSTGVPSSTPAASNHPMLGTTGFLTTATPKHTGGKSRR